MTCKDVSSELSYFRPCMTGRTLLFIRDLFGISSSDFARFAGKSVETVHRWEDRKQSPGYTFRLLACCIEERLEQSASVLNLRIESQIADSETQTADDWHSSSELTSDAS